MARLPQPGGDSGNWGNILNDYLSQTLKTDGSIKDDAVTASAIAPNAVTSAAIATNAVDATAIADGSITETLLATAVQTKLNAIGGSADWNALSNKPTVIAAGADAAAAKATLSLTKSDVGLGNLDNTSDASKPISTATQTALGHRVTVVIYAGNLNAARPSVDAVYWIDFPSTPTNAQSQDIVANTSNTISGMTLDNTNTVTLKDNNFIVQDDTDATKQAKFQLSGITTSTTQTLTVPDASGTLALTSALNYKTVRLNDTGSETYTISAGNVTQIAGTALDGISPAIGDRIFICSAPATTGVGSFASNQPGNGIYVVTGNTTNLTLARASDMSGSETPIGTTVYIRDGNNSAGWLVSCSSPTTGAFTWGTTPNQWAYNYAPYGYIRDGIYTFINKTINLTSNTLSGTTAQFNTANTDADFYTTGGTDVAITDGGTGVSSLPSGLLKGAGTSAITAAVAGTDYIVPDANGNLSADSFIPGATSTVTAGSTTTLTVNSTQIQVFTGTTTQIVTLPTTSIVAGHSLTINNQSTGKVTVNASGGNTFAILEAKSTLLLQANTATPTTPAGWSIVGGTAFVAGQVDPQSLWAAGNAESTSRYGLTAAAFTSGIAVFTQFVAPVANTITKLGLGVTSQASAGLTVGRLGLYTVAANGDLTMVARTANTTTLGNTGDSFTPVTLDANGGFVTSYTFIPGQRYALVCLEVGTTMNGIFAMVSSNVDTALSPVMNRWIGSQTDLATSYTNGSLNNGWFMSPYIVGLA